MYIRSVQVDSFRNLESQKIELAKGVNLLIGDNGQGKTNLLEAIHLLSTLKSFRPATIMEMIQRERKRAELSASFMASGVPTTLRLRLEKGGRRLWMGQRQISGVSEYLGKLNVVAFTPDDLAMIKGNPSTRRRFLDRSTFLFHPEHLKTVQSFSAALRSRNRLLAQKGSCDRLQLDSFTEIFATHGSAVSKRRMEQIDCLRSPAINNIQELSDGAMQAQMIFRPGWNVDSGEGIEALRNNLKKNLDRDMLRGTTTAGPQMDDFELLIDGSSARRFSSQGQQRACAVALLLSLVEEVVARGGEQPVVLLDDVSSELDSGVRGRLFERVNAIGGQILVTTTDDRLVQELRDGAERVFSVRSGRVVCEGD